MFTKHILVATLLILIINESYSQQVGLKIKKAGIYDGYTLFAPLNSKNTYLINNCGNLIHEWVSEYTPGDEVKLLENGDILRLAKLENNVIDGGGGGGRIEQIDWDSNLKWSFELNNDSLRLHHDFEVLPNNNVLLLVWKAYTKESVIEAGRYPDSIATDVIWSEHLIEVKPIFPDSAEIVWTWDLFDHLVQDLDPTKDNYGVVEEHPELIDINFNTDSGIDDWIHANSISYSEKLDQIIISSRTFSEFWIIDHSTSNLESSSHNGGIYNKGGDILYRWGNPISYKKGQKSDRKLYSQHNVHWINTDISDSNDIMIFNNGNTRNPAYSSIDRLTVSLDENNNYVLNDDLSYAPLDFNWTYTAVPKENFFSRFLSSSQLLENDNILICEGATGRFFEINQEGDILWEYINPVNQDGITNRDFELSGEITGNIAFRVAKYSSDFPAFDNRSLLPSEPVEGKPWFIPDECLIAITSTETTSDTELFKIYPNPTTSKVIINFKSVEMNNLKLFNLHGELLLKREGISTITYQLDISEYPQGTYLLVLNNSYRKLIIRN